MEAVILAGGRGTRLASVVPDLPKPMAPIAGRPFLSYLLRALELGGVRRVVLSTGYRAESIEGHFGSRFGALELVYSHESTPLGTGGAIRQSLRQVLAEHVFVVNGDTFADVDYRAMFRAHLLGDEALSVALAAVPDTQRYGAVSTAGSRVAGFTEKGVSGPGWINGGVYLLRRSLVAELDVPPPFSFEEEVLRKQLERLRPAAFPAAGYFIDIGIPEDYARAARELPELTREHANNFPAGSDSG